MDDNAVADIVVPQDPVALAAAHEGHDRVAAPQDCDSLVDDAIMGLNVQALCLTARAQRQDD